MITSRSVALSSAVAIALATLLGSAGCGSNAGDPPAATTSQAILNGTPVPSDNLAQVWICNGYSSTACSYICSGTMIANQWVLTAHHCATLPPVLTGGTATPAKQMAVGIPGAGTSFYNSEVYLNPSLDVALVHTDSPVTNAAGAVETIPMWTGSSASLVGQTLLAEGCGFTNLTGAGWTWANVSVTSALLTVQSAFTGQITLLPNGSGQAVYEGDSGGASILPSIDQVVGVHSVGNTLGPGVPPSSTVDIGVDGFYAWAEGVIESNGPCTPKTQEQACLVSLDPGGGILRHYCGAEVNQPDGCGGSIHCGTCAKGHPCVDGLCTLSY